VAGVAGRGIERRISGRSMIRLREAPCSEVNLSRPGCGARSGCRSQPKTELGPPITSQPEFQPGNLGLGSQRIMRHGDNALQCNGVVGVWRPTPSPVGACPTRRQLWLIAQHFAEAANWADIRCLHRIRPGGRQPALRGRRA
jgi:hypothetical protein